jgi:phage/plasmid-associated DNA primase
MCNGITKAGKQCTRKAEWCKQHINQKTKAEKLVVEDSIIDDVSDYDDVSDDEEEIATPEVTTKFAARTTKKNVEVEKKDISVNIVPTMSPNIISTSERKLDTTTLGEGNLKPIKKIFDDYECFVTHKGTEYQYWIDKCALSTAYVSWRILAPNGEYLHDIKGCRVIKVNTYVNAREYSKYVWFYNTVDMHAFINLFHKREDRECHELFLGRDPTIKLFLDLEKVIPKSYYNKLKVAAKPVSVGEMICADIMTALNNTLELVDECYDEYESTIDYAIAERVRDIDDNNTKISFHLITNIAMHVSECKAVVKLMKAEYLNMISNIGDEYKQMLCDKSFVDTLPYRRNGSLSLPGGTKRGHTIKMVKAFACKTENMHLLDVSDCIRCHQFTDDLMIQNNQSERESFEESSSEFVKKALSKLDADRLPAYDPTAMELYANPIRFNFLRVKRVKPSYCPACDRVHDNADTLLLIFNEKDGAAYWKCAHCEGMKAKRWFGNHSAKEVDVGEFEEDDLEAFAAKELPKPAAESVKDKPKSKKKPAVVMKEKLIKLAKNLYRREFGTGAIYKKKTDYYYTREFSDPKEFLNAIFANDEMYQMCSQSEHKELLHFIKDIAHPEFPFAKIDYDYIGFTNGVYCVKDDTFLKLDFVPAGIQVRVYHDFDFVLLDDTPLLDKYFGYQFDTDTTEFIYFMFGRALTKIKDKFDFMVMLVGIGGAGKSLLMNLHCYSFGVGQVGIFGNTFQDKFGLSEFANKQIVTSDDMPRNIAKTLPKSDFLSMQSRGRISCPVKGGTSIEVDSWDLPTIINSNDLPNYSDTSGEIIRRIMVTQFNNAVPDEEKDMDLEEKIKASEYCTFLHRCRKTYLDYCARYKGQNIYTFCPQHFLDSRDMLRSAINESYQFSILHVKYCEGETIAKPDITKWFRAYIKEKYNLSKSPKQALDIQSVVNADPRMKFVREQVCKSCRNKHAKGCCSAYSRTNRTLTEYITNADYSPFAIME